MRNRVKNYSIGIFNSDSINIKFEVSSKVYHSLTTVSGSNIELNTSSFNKVVEAIRLIADETRSYNLCMTGQKNVFSKAYRYNEAGVYYVQVVTSRTVLIEAADGDEDDIAAIGDIAYSDKFTIEVDWGDDMEDQQRAILGEPQGIDCPDGIPACDFGDFGNDVLIGDNDYEIAPMSVNTFPEGFGVGAVVRNTGMEQPENYSIAIAADNPELIYSDGELSFSSGVTWIQMPVNKPYVCVQELTVTCDDVEGEPYSGKLFIYQEATAENLQDILKAVKANSGDPALRQFFGLPEALPEYTALTPAEAIAIARDCQYNVMGTDWPIPTWLPTGVTEAQVESAAEGLGIPYHEPTQTA